MCLTFKEIYDADKWYGWSWTVNDEDRLAEMIARVAIGQYRIVEKIINHVGIPEKITPKGGFEGAKRLLRADKDDDVQIYKRDGWVFQIISWIAAHHKYKDGLIFPPHSRLADKGQDGLIVEFDELEIARVVICEEKATVSPRKRVKKEVWKEFEEYETGIRDNELISSLTLLLNASNTQEENDVDAIVSDILWTEMRAYRVSVTIDGSKDTLNKYRNLFKGYDKCVRGDKAKRRAETLVISDLRNWMQILADKALRVVEELEIELDV